MQGGQIQGQIQQQQQGRVINVQGPQGNIQVSMQGMQPGQYPQQQQQGGMQTGNVQVSMQGGQIQGQQGRVINVQGQQGNIQVTMQGMQPGQYPQQQGGMQTGNVQVSMQGGQTGYPQQSAVLQTTVQRGGPVMPPQPMGMVQTTTTTQQVMATPVMMSSVTIYTQPMRFQLRQKFISWAGDMDIKNALGETIINVRGKAFSWGHNMIFIHTQTHDELGQIKQKNYFGNAKIQYLPSWN